MKAAALGHQYLNARSINENDTHFNLGRIRGTRRQQRKALKSEDGGDRFNQIYPASEPLSRRTISNDDNLDVTTSTSANFARSFSESKDMYVVFEQQPTETVRFELDHAGNEVSHYFLLENKSTVLDHKPYSLKSLLTKKHGD